MAVWEDEAQEQMARQDQAMRQNAIEGDWSGGVMHGEGMLKMKDGGKYEGQFERGAMTGVGMRTSSPAW